MAKFKWGYVDLVLGGLTVLFMFSAPQPHQWPHFFAGWLISAGLFKVGWRQT